MTDTDDNRQHFQFVGGTKLADFITSNREVDVIEGPIGSGKTVALCLRIMRHAQEQQQSPIDGLRYTRFALVRNSFPDLRRTTIRTWLDIFSESIYGRFNWSQSALCHRISFDDVRLEVDFLALDKPEDVRKLRSAEYTGIAFNELSFIEKMLFDESTSRLRYPKPDHGGPTWRGIIADTNAPSEDHWLATMTGQVDPPPGLTDAELREYQWPEQWGFHLQPPAMIEEFDSRGHVKGYRINPVAENLKNLPADYYQRMLPLKSRAWIDSLLMVRVVLVVDGSPVWPMFRREFHVSPEPLRPTEGREVLVALDFGRVYPAALFSQEINNRINIQHEMLGFNEGATVFAPKVKRFLEQTYPNCTFRCVGDPKGADKAQSSEQSSYDVFRAHGMPVTPAPVKQNNIAERLEAVAYALNDNPSGVSRIAISPRCRTLIIGMAGRYHLMREQDGELRPKKDKYSNLCDCLQYKMIALGEGRRMMALKPVGSMKPAMLIRPRGSRRRVA